MTTTTTEFAELAAAVYQVNVAPSARLPVPDGWTEITRNSFESGFEVATYRKGSEVTFAFAGTTDFPDWSLANIPLGAGLPSAQLWEAILYVKGVQSALASESNTYSLTGHSLGGGLAALVSAYLDIPAVCFDAAPFAAGLASVPLYESVKAVLLAEGVTDSAFDSYFPGRTLHVSNYAIAGEALSLAPDFLRIGSSTVFFDTDPAITNPIDRHSMNLLAATMAVPGLELLLTELPGVGLGLLGKVPFGGTLPSLPLITRLLADKMDNGSDNSALGRFISDFWRAKEGLVGSGDAIGAKLLVAVAMDVYQSHALSEVSGGVFTTSGDVKPEYLTSSALVEAARVVFLQGSENDAAALGNMADAADPRWSAAIRTLLSSGTTQGVDAAQLSPIDADEKDMPATYWSERAFFIKQVALGRLEAGKPVELDGRTVVFSNGGEVVAGWAVDALYGTKNADHLIGSMFADALYGGQGQDQLEGNGGVDELYGGKGNDTLDGGADSDTLYGGDDDDIYIVDSAEDFTVELLNGGVDTVRIHGGALTSGSYTLQSHIENGELLADAEASSLHGNSLANRLVGNEFANSFFGEGGDDTLEGKGGNDMYYLLDASDASGAPDDVIELADEGADTVIAQMFEYTLSANVENLTMSSGPQGSYVIGRGNELANNMVLIGADVQGQLFGYAGDDNLTGATGGDYLVGGSGYDRLFGENGDDTLDGNDGDSDELYGGAGADQLFADQDLVVGGVGNNRIWGGAGSTFQWGQGDGLDSVYTTSEADTIKFTPNESGSLYSVTASFDGDDMVLSTGNGEGVTVKNWKSWGGKCNIELPNGDIVTPTELEGFLHPAVTGWSYSGGVFDGSAFEAVVRSQHGVFNDNANLWQDLAGWSLFDWVWQSGTQSGTYTGRFQGDKPIYSWGSSGGMHVPGATNMSDPYSALWHELQYDFWQKDGGGWEFAITSASAGYGGQVNYYYDSVEERWEGYPVNKLYAYSDYNSRTEYEISPAVTSVVLYDGGSSAMTTAASRQTSDADMLFGAGAVVDTQEMLVRQVLDGQSQELAGASVWVETEDAASASADLFYASEGAWLRLGSGVPTAVSDAQVSTQPVGLAAYGALNLPSEPARVSIMPVPTKEFLLVA